MSSKLYMAVITSGYMSAVIFKGKVIGRGAVVYRRTIRECRAWAEKLDGSAERCEIYKCFGRKGDILVGIHQRGADSKWRRATIEPEP